MTCKVEIKSSQCLERNKVIALTALFVTTLLVYIYTFKVGFVWDDKLFIDQQLTAVKDYNFLLGLKQATYFRPTVTLFSILDHTIWYKNPFGYHLSNFFFHLSNVYFVLILTYLLFRNYWMAFLAGLIFAIHSVHTESVNWIEGRTDLICTTFFLMAFTCYIYFRERHQKKALFPFTIFAILAVGAKETGVALFLVLFLYEILHHRQKILFAFLPLFLGIGFIALRSNLFQKIVISILKKQTFIVFFEKVIRAYGFYLQKIFLPIKLNFFIGALPESKFFFVFSSLSLVLLLGLFLFYSKRRPEISFCIGWWFITLLPVMCILRGGIAVTPVAERYLYLPSVAFCSVIGYVLYLIFQKNRCIGIFMCLFIFAFYAHQTYTRTMLWTDEEKLWADTVKKSPEFGIPAHWYGTILGTTKGKLREAISVLEIALRKPYMCGKGMDISGKDEYWRKSLICLSIGGAYAQLNEDVKAEEYFKKALYYFASPEAYYVLGSFYLKKAEYHTPDGKIYFEEDLVRKAGRCFEHCLKFRPGLQRAHFKIGMAYYLIDNKEKARKHFKKAIKIDPRSEWAKKTCWWLGKLQGQ